MFYVFSTMTRAGRPILFPAHHTHTYISTAVTTPLSNTRPPYASHPRPPSSSSPSHPGLPRPPHPLTPGCVGPTPGALLSLRGGEERDLTSSLQSKGRSPLYYLLMERSASMNRKVGSTHNVKRMLFSFLLLLLLLSTCPVSTLRSLPPP